jgi:DNA gyrase subunit B
MAERDIADVSHRAGVPASTLRRQYDPGLLERPTLIALRLEHLAERGTLPGRDSAGAVPVSGWGRGLRRLPRRAVRAPVHPEVMAFEREDLRTAGTVEVALRWCGSRQERVRSFANSVPTPRRRHA